MCILLNMKLWLMGNFIYPDLISTDMKSKHSGKRGEGIVFFQQHAHPLMTQIQLNFFFEK